MASYLCKKGKKKTIKKILKKPFLQLDNNKKDHKFFMTLNQILNNNQPYVNLLKFQRKRTRKQTFIVVPIKSNIQKRLQTKWIVDEINSNKSKEQFDKKFNRFLLNQQNNPDSKVLSKCSNFYKDVIKKSNNLSFDFFL